MRKEPKNPLATIVIIRLKSTIYLSYNVMPLIKLIQKKTDGLQILLLNCTTDNFLETRGKMLS